MRHRYVKEQFTFNGEDVLMSTLLHSLMGAFAEVARNLLRDGMALARK